MAKTATRPARNCRGRRNLTLWCRQEIRPRKDAPSPPGTWVPPLSSGTRWRTVNKVHKWCASPRFCRRNRYPPLNASSSIPKEAQFQRETDTGFDTAEVAVYTTNTLVARNKTTAINRISHDKTVSPPVRCQIKVRSLPRQGKARQGNSQSYKVCLMQHSQGSPSLIICYQTR